MWDTVQVNQHPLSHDLPCPACGHGPHFYLPCGDGCDCPPSEVPGRAPAKVAVAA